MFKKLLPQFLLFLIISLSGCAIAPLTSGLTARGLEDGKLEVDSQFSSYTDSSGSLVVTPNARLLYGVVPHWTVGMMTELKTFTFLVRYSVIDSEKADGFSLAPIAAAVLLGNQFSYYLGFVASYLVQKFEPSLAYRYNLVSFDTSQVDSSLFQLPPPFRFNFSSIHVGLKYWFTPELAGGGEWIFLTNGANANFVVSNLLSIQLSFIL
jgi:hypothetical protein